ncbi:hypothetical protein CDV31_014339 [Fusarium ambrosium]|uniref:DUF1868 domain-containing protein n=1 Tax=Fusarium ambrosium TaxID=131363 RepID=A0A428SX05_9HYPO|nr:hypothetical protein CDV31_014339 [Fusarium ambrosium]
MTVPSTFNTEQSSTPERPPYPTGVPFKFAPDGTVQHYPGNTTVCHIPPSSPLIPGLRKIYDSLSSHPTFSKVLRLLPPSSWHMTVFDGVREKECEPGMWPPGLAKQPLHESTADFSKRLRQFGLNLEAEGLAPPYRMAVRGFDLPATVGVGLRVEGATPGEERRMRRLRDRLGDTLGFKAPNHETYRFHITIAYLLRHIDGNDRDEFHRVLMMQVPDVEMDFELGRVEFCLFENMLAFPRVFYLGDKEENRI